MEESDKSYLFNLDYFTKSNLVKNKNKIKEEIQELCCDEYLYWLEKVPPIIFEIFSFEELVTMASSNGSILCTKYFIKRFDKKINKILYTWCFAILEQGCKGNYNQYVKWILNDLITNDLITEDNAGISDKIEVYWHNSYFERLFSYLFVNNNIELFKEFEKKKYFLDYILRNKIALFEVLCKRKNSIEFVKYFLSNYNFINKQIILNIFNRTIFYDYDVFKYIYEKVKPELDNNNIEKFLENNFIILKIIMEFENEPVFNKDLAELLIHRLFGFNTCRNIQTYKNKIYDRYNEYHDENFKNVFKYLYWKLEPDSEDKKLIYNSVRFRKNFRFGQFVCEYLIDDGLVIESYKEPYWDYYIYKKRIQDKLDWYNYNESINFFYKNI